VEFEIGKTRTGLVLTLVAAVEELQSSDAFDALAVLEAFAVRELSLRGPTKDFDIASYKAARLFQRLDEAGHLNVQMLELGLNTYADRLRFGVRLLNAAYKDW